MLVFTVSRRDIIQRVAQKAADLNYDGLMIESHVNPDEAWKDGRQQITPETFKEMMQNIIWRNPNPDGAFDTMLEKLREQINQIDDELLNLLGSRMKVSEQIGEYKKEKNMTILQNSRWNEVVEKGLQAGTVLGLSPEFIDKYLTAIHMESINHQNRVMNTIEKLNSQC